MGMFDTIGPEQVKCFDCEFKSYGKGDFVPCKKYNYKKNLLIIPFDTSLLNDSWKSYELIFIKDSKVKDYKKLDDITEDDFKNIEEVIDYYGDNKIKISNLNDLLNYIEDIMILNIKDEMDRLRKIDNDNYSSFKNKWYINQ